ncbi:MAG: hypothetical protein HC847_26615 [Hydrococcus sp. RU_2_2]|nr:hypothetical protein [Hydrococcus sp. RU_2_2]NJP20398.1 hypothetical protein [Hydrococcus sp. CRU_1_1]
MNESLSLHRSIASFMLGSLGVREKEVSLVRANVATETIRQIPCVVGVFYHHRDVKVAIAQLKDAGIPMGWIVAIARDYRRYDRSLGIKISDRFDEQLLDIAPGDRMFFYKCFKQGKSLVIVEGEENAIRLAGAIMSRRRGHSEVWYM